MFQLGLESNSSRPLLESTGWLAAHRRSQSSMKRNPVNNHRNSLSGQVASERTHQPRSLDEWRSWSLRLFSRLAPAPEETPGLNES